MKFHDRYHVDKGAQEDGTWADLGDDIKVKVRRLNSAHAKATRRALEEPHLAALRAGNADDLFEDILIKQMAQSLVLDWRGVTDSTGAPMSATPENVEAILREYPEFREEVGAKIMDRQTFKKQVRDEDLKNF